MTDGRMMLVSFLKLVTGNNQGMGDIAHGGPGMMTTSLSAKRRTTTA
jgi:hypothetical protein